MTVNWNTIRSYNNSQNNAFEELVCQLAREENIKGGKEFIRVGTPDGGVEAYWVLNDNSEKGQKLLNTAQEQVDVQWERLELYKNL